ncbi:hypothetical protein TVAG_062000 [Trichomonas vaginalis G3]|uniref:Cyclin, N-terminal domain containing protein n=1 Tax=Trichomonas vaginalis (strain ATCC PRA-98 / G3) TaxID=412133 RepID=A2E7W5_TRIV3|nr:positive regulation of phosphorylation of RNA polymerase II C-terminal domain [Trichomonas vaginalis G3]EAY11296.1 hypothetical protein TVAG_062000 [Trichomonas vaginalis G3]KAI5526662.1 positive regulation of phosphorylation of RNA polymerase II C-terminal domain [Trichomonas vaginalis G3]|eukprot:XP_001323519.1 hypothetical protein [Trichomonas vaginalis G3]
MDFNKSTQARNWLFFPEELEELRRGNYNEIGEIVSSNISYEDYRGYIQYYADELLKYAAKIEIWNSYQVYTALALYQRVYVRKTIWDIPPPLAMMNALFIVCKFIFPIKFSELVRVAGFKQELIDRFKPYEQIAKSEVICLTGWKFNLKIHLPIHHLYGIVDGRLDRESFEKCLECLKQILQTDALLLFPPGQIAFAAVAITCGMDTAVSFLPEAKQGTDPNVPLVDELAQVTEAIQNLKKPEYDPARCMQVEEQYGIEYVVQETLTRAQAQPENPTEKSIVPPSA